MPVYEYLCSGCGPFTRLRAMADYELPSACPDCGASAPRVMLTAPRCRTVSTQSRLDPATNERGADTPTASFTSNSHNAGCACCSASMSRMFRRAKDGSKSFSTV